MYGQKCSVRGRKLADQSAHCSKWLHYRCQEPAPADLTSLRFFKPGVYPLGLASEAFPRLVNIEQIGLIRLD
jgi:hypothetical protein